MKYWKSTLTMVLVGLAGYVHAHAPEAIQSRAEHGRLAYFVGTWQSTGELKSSPSSSPEKLNSTDRNYMLGDFFLVMNMDGHSARGDYKIIAVHGYDPVREVYTYHGFDSMGVVEEFTGQVEDDTWTWFSTTTIDGEAAKVRFTAQELTKSAYSYRYDYAVGDEWHNVLEGKAVKVTAATAS